MLNFITITPLKLATTSTGIDVTGTVTSDGLTVAQSNPVITITDTDGSTNTTLKTVGSNTELSNPSGGNLRFRTNASELERMRISPDGDISFYEDTGTTAKFFWDASAERLGLGTSSPNKQLTLSNPSNTSVLNLNRSNAASADDGYGTIEFSDSSDNALARIVGRKESGTDSYLQFLTTENGGSITERLRIDSSGRVGIGTTSPSETLHVNGTVKVTGTQTFNVDSGGGSYIAVNHSGNESWSWDARSGSGADDYLDVGISGGTRAMSWHEDGKVGIGTSSPQTELHVHDSAGLSQIRLSGTASDADTFQLGQGTTGVTNGGFTIRDVEASADRLVINSSGNVGIGTSSPAKNFHVHSGNQSDIVKFENDNGGFVLGKTANLGSLDMASDANFRIRHGGTVSATFKSDGNVGIGTNNPTEKLHVSSGSFKIDTDTNSTFKISDAGTDAIALYGGTGDELYMGANNAYSLRFKTDGNIVMDNGGNLGIGTNNPTQKLVVSGNVSATAYYGDGSNLTGVGGSTTAGAVGTYMFAVVVSSFSNQSAGDTRAGSTLREANAWNSSNGITVGYNNNSLSGTWRCMGDILNYNGGSTETTAKYLSQTLWLRIS